MTTQATKVSAAVSTEADEAAKRYGAVLFFSDFDDPVTWGDALKANIPGLDFRVYPDVGDPADVRHVLAWKPPPGFFEP